MSVQCPFCGNDTDYMTVGQVAKLMGVTRVTVIRWIKQGRFPGTAKVPTGLTPDSFRIPASAVLPLIQERAAQA